MGFPVPCPYTKNFLVGFHTVPVFSRGNYNHQADESSVTLCVCVCVYVVCVCVFFFSLSHRG